MSINSSQQNQQQTHSLEELFQQEWSRRKFLIEQDEPIVVKKLRDFLLAFRGLKRKLMLQLRSVMH